MLANNVDGKKWQNTVIKKLLSFCEKSPVLLSVQTGYNEGKDGVFIIHKNTGNKYFFEWQYEEEPQVFIHKIKDFLVGKHYPLIIESIYEPYTFTPKELAEKLENGHNIEDLKKSEFRLTAKKLWRIDKIILWRDIAILEEIDPKTGLSISDKKSRYKYNGSLFLYMRSYRSGVFQTLEEAGTEFFKNASLISEIKSTNEPKENPKQ